MTIGERKYLEGLSSDITWAGGYGSRRGRKRFVAVDQPTIRKRDRGTIAFYMACFFILSIAVLFRLVAMSGYSLDGDEIFSVNAANSSWQHLLSTVAADKSHPPLHYALLKTWMAAGPDKESWFRLLSVLFGSGLLVITIFICSHIALGRTDTALILILFAVNEDLIFYAHHTRMFALLEFFAAVWFLAFIRFIQTPLSRWNTVLLTMAGILTVYSHYWGWFLAVPQILIIAFGRREKLGALAVSIGAIAVSFVPWAVAVALHAPPHDSAMEQIKWMGHEVVGISNYAFLFGTFNGIINIDHAISISIVLFMLPVVLYSVMYWKFRGLDVANPRSPTFWTLFVVLPLGLTSLASYLVNQNLWGNRHLSMVAAPYFILVGLSISGLTWTPATKNLLRGFIIAWAIVPITITMSVRNPDGRVHWDEIVKVIESRSPAPIFTSESFVRDPIIYYIKNKESTSVDPRDCTEIGAINAPEFWFVFRDINWKGTDPREQIRAQGAVIEAETSMRFGKQLVEALLVRTASKPTRSFP